MSQLDSQSDTIGDHTFEVFKLPPLDAQDILIEILHALAPAAGKVVNVLEDGGLQNLMEAKIESLEAGEAIVRLSQGITKERMRELVKVMATVTRCDGKKLNATMEVVFRGDLPLMYQWLWFALKVQFGNFLEPVRNVITRALRAGAVKSKSQPISDENGPSSS